MAVAGTPVQPPAAEQAPQVVPDPASLVSPRVAPQSGLQHLCSLSRTLEQPGSRRFELAFAGVLGIVFLGFAYDLAADRASPRGIAVGFVPGMASDRLLLVSGIIGATVMQHVTYLLSALTKSRVSCRDDAERRELLRFQRLDVLVAPGAAGPGNLAVLFVAASGF